ncbi:hypothetical protein CCM_00727 [Cordyceps militaris CM01]|uniref:Uncharacterized protein n=1 Tax=Cordyceps militaris (strain CM01) TaxID=983644 RepID=G3J5R5_CORMM|nr:uncharacterized protein CCM_00727 [Cordyceps militaris CM01]EGX96072.1 hypothetical protein CCM_00727 [Cordyceps militaris CM01]
MARQTQCQRPEIRAFLGLHFQRFQTTLHLEDKHSSLELEGAISDLTVAFPLDLTAYTRRIFKAWSAHTADQRGKRLSELGWMSKTVLILKNEEVSHSSPCNQSCRDSLILSGQTSTIMLSVNFPGPTLIRGDVASKLGKGHGGL